MQTSAHTLAYACILLALYPDEQEKFYQNLKKVLPEGRSPVSRPGPRPPGSTCTVWAIGEGRRTHADLLTRVNTTRGYGCRRTTSSRLCRIAWRTSQFPMLSHALALLTRPSVLNNSC